MNINKLKHIMSVRNVTQKEIADKINMSQTAFSAAMIRGDFKVATLEKIAKVLRVNPGIFFIDDVNSSAENDNIILNEPLGNYNIRDVAETNKLIDKLTKERDEAILMYTIQIKSMNYLVNFIKDVHGIDLLGEGEFK